MLSVKSKKSINWKNINDIVDAKRLVDMGHLLSWSEGRTVVKFLGEEKTCDLVRHMALRMGDRFNDRLASEILVESLYSILTASGRESIMIAFLEALFDSDEFEGITRNLVEISLGGEVGEDDLSKTVVSAAVALICEIGLNIQRVEDDDPGRIDKSRSISDHIAAYLLSVSNTNVQAVRLCLLRYFSQTEYGNSAKKNYNRLMGRFGHSIMEALFQQLFVKKSEKVAAQFLLENLPCALEAGGETQKMLHETLKQHMLKESERFCLFMHELGSHVLSLGHEGELCHAAQSYSRHLIALYKVTSDLGHKHLGREVLQELYKFAPFGDCADWIRNLEVSSEIRKSFRELAVDYRVKVVQVGKGGKVVSQFRVSKRGRKPTLGKGDFGFLEQVTTLGEYEVRHSA
jgi:hypothetical protein